MSTLKVNNIQTAAGGSNSTPEQIEQGRAKAWIRFDQTNNSIQSSFNVSSITDVTTAITDINFTTAFANANYTFAGMCGNNNNFMALNTNTQDPLAGELRVASCDAGNSLQESSDAGVIVFG